MLVAGARRPLRAELEALGLGEPCLDRALREGLLLSGSLRRLCLSRFLDC